MLNGDSNENGKNKNNRSKGTIKRAAKKTRNLFWNIYAKPVE